MLVFHVSQAVFRKKINWGDNDGQRCVFMDNNEQKSSRKAKLSDVNIKDKPLTLALTACFPSEIMQPVLSLFSLTGSPKVGEIQTCHTNKQGVTVLSCEVQEVYVQQTKHRTKEVSQEP